MVSPEPIRNVRFGIPVVVVDFQSWNETKGRPIDSVRIQKRLRAITNELRRVNQELQVAGEQLSFQTDVATDAQNQKVISQTPLADRDFKEAQADLERIRKHYERLRQQIENLNKEQDRLLDEMVIDGGRF